MKKTRTIKNINEFLIWVKSLKSSEGNPSFPLNNVFYRGHASSKWKLNPGIFRENVANEHDIFVAASNRCWSETSSFNNLEKMVYFQHFGLQTRLLDVTSNPLVALYFACQEFEDNDGQVRYGYSNVDDIRIVKIIANVIAQFDIDHMYPGESFLKRLGEEYKFNKTEILKEQLSRPYYVNAPFNSPRIVAQRGAFLMPPLLKKLQDEYIFTTDYDFDNEDKQFCMFGQRNVIIKNENKQNILRELRSIGFDEASIYMDTPHILSSINKTSQTLK